jgi:tyrosyl-tRNA synthetase
MSEIAQMKEAVQNGDNPMVYKKRLASEVVAFYHSKEAALKAEKFSEETVQNKEISEETIISVKVAEKTTLLEFLKQAVGDQKSSADIKRVIDQGGVEINGTKITDSQQQVTTGLVIKFGKREFFRVG